MTSYRHQIAILKSAVTFRNAIFADVCRPSWPVAGLAKSLPQLHVCWRGDDHRRSARRRRRHRDFAGSTHKLLAELDGVPVFRRALDHLLEAGFEHVVVVTGAAPLDITARRCHGRAQPRLGRGSGRLAAARRCAAAIALGAVSSSWSGSPINRSSRRRRGGQSPTHQLLADRRRHLRRRRGPNPVRLQPSVWSHLPT